MVRGGRSLGSKLRVRVQNKAGTLRMPIDWSLVTTSHVQKACEAVAAKRTDRNSGLIVYFGERQLPAKEVLREAYRLAKGLAANAEVNFASGDATLNLLRKLGYRAERHGSRSKSAPSSGDA